MCRAVSSLLLLIVISCAGAKTDFAQGGSPKPHLGAETQVVGHNAAAQHAAAEQQVVPAQINQLAAVATGAISGVAQNASGGIIATATVRVRNKTTNQIWTGTTDAQGRFSVAGLPLGAYSVTFVSAGFQVRTMDSVAVSFGQATIVNTVLNPAAAKVQAPPQFPMPVIVAVQPGTVESAKKPPEPKPVGPNPPDPKPVDPKPLDPVAAENKAFQDWHKSLPQGLSEYHVPLVMRLGTESAVTFTIHGDKAPPFTPEPGNTPGKLQVSPKMSVYLTQPRNLDGFKITDVDTPQNPKRVAPDGSTTWTWSVTPQKLGPLELHIEAFVLRDESGSDKVSYKSYDAQIDVKSVSLWGYLTSGLTWVLQNPVDSLKWILPGGAGAAMIGKLILWLLAKRKKKPDAA